MKPKKKHIQFSSESLNHIRSLGVAVKMETKLKCLGIMSKDMAVNFKVP